MEEDSSTRWKGENDEEEEKEKLGEENEEVDPRAASKLTCFEDMVELVGSRGRWSVRLFVTCSLAGLFAVPVSMSYQFLGATPDHWCSAAPLKAANWTDTQIIHLAIPFNNDTNQYARCHMYDYNYTKAAMLGYEAAVSHPEDLTHGDVAQTVSCSARDFNLTQYKSSVVTEWDLVCERRVLYATTQAVNQFGFLVGAIVTPILTDKFGRRPVALWMICLTLLFGLSSCFSTSAEVFIALRCCFSAVSLVYYLCAFLILMEWCSPSMRSAFGSLFVMFWAVGCMILPGVAYLVRPWRYLQAACSLPFLISLITYRILPESPRWLLLEARHKEVEDALVQIAAANHRKAPSRTLLGAALARISQQMRAEREQHGRGAQREKYGGNVGGTVVVAVRQMLLPYSTLQLARRMCLLLVLWFSAASTYYGLALNATNISADPYSYIFLGGVCEVPAYLMLWLLVARVGRRPSLCGMYFVCALCIAVNATLMFAFPGVPVAAKIALSLVGKMSIGAAFHLLYLYTAELFTTQQRSMAVSQCCLFGRVGSIASPYINDLLGDKAAWAPSAVFSVMALLSALLAIPLPETRNLILPEDDKGLGRAKKQEVEEELIVVTRHTKDKNSTCLL